MTTLLEKFNKEQLKELPEIRPGDTIKVHQKISTEGGGKTKGKESKGERIQIFEGIVIARKHGKGINSTITVRKIVDGVGVERIFPVNSPAIAKIEVLRRGKVRRGKLYYLRTAKGKKARLKNKEFAEAIADPEQNPADIEINEESAEKEVPLPEAIDKPDTKESVEKSEEVQK